MRVKGANSTWTFAASPKSACRQVRQKLSRFLVGPFTVVASTKAKTRNACFGQSGVVLVFLMFCLACGTRLHPRQRRSWLPRTHPAIFYPVFTLHERRQAKISL